MTWFEFIGGIAFKEWLIKTSTPARLRQSSKLDPLASSMRKLHKAHGWLNDIFNREPSDASSSRSAQQRVIDLRSAKLLSSEGELSPLGINTLILWNEKKLEPDNEDHEIPRCLGLLQEAVKLNQPEYLGFISFWRQVRELFSFEFIISRAELLYFVSYLDKTEEEYNPWVVISRLKLGDQYFDSGLEWNRIGDFYGKDISEAIAKYNEAIIGYASREGRSNFCTALELLTEMSDLEQVLEVKQVSENVKTLIREMVKSNPQNIVLASQPSVLPALPRNRILFGPPGTGKSSEIKTEYANKKKYPGLQKYRVTFHPDYEYGSFVGSYKPVSIDISGKKEVHYEYVPQEFIRAYTNAWNDPDHAHFLIIEEINRGNCAQIFGDLFQSLDRDINGFSEYEVDTDFDLAKYLDGFFKANSIASARLSAKLQEYDCPPDAYSKIILPNNLYIYATMNTSDQSLFPMDSAFKRRWDWVYVPINYEPQNEEGQKIEFWIDLGALGLYSWSEFIKKANKAIREGGHSEDKQLGFWFIKPNNGKTIDTADFKSKVLFYLWFEVFRNEPDNSIFPNTIQLYGTTETELFVFGHLFDSALEKHLLKEIMDKLTLISQNEPVIEQTEIIAEPAESIVNPTEITLK